MKNTNRSKALTFDTICAQCGRPIAECNVPGLHGMVRERMAKAAKQMKAAAK